MTIPSRLAQLVGRALSPWGELGWVLLLERSLINELPEANPSLGVTLRLATPDDIDEISRFYAADPRLYIVDGPPTPENHEIARHLYLDRLRRGELCFLAVSGGTIAHVNWVCFTEAEGLPGHPIRLRQGEVFTTDAFTTPAFRGKGLRAFVLRAMLAHARATGAQLAYTLARVDRPDAHKGLFQLGWRECGRVLYFRPHGRSGALFLRRHGNVEPLFRPAGVQLCCGGRLYEALSTMPDGPRYEDDFYAWTQHQAEVLRTLHTEDNRFDREHLAEEIEDLGKSERDAVRSQVRRVLLHFLKLAHSPARDPRSDWMNSIDDARAQIEDKLTRTLRRDTVETLPRLYAIARKQVARDLEKYSEVGAAKSLPPECPYTIEQILAEDWYPDPLNDPQSDPA